MANNVQIPDFYLLGRIFCEAINTLRQSEIVMHHLKKLKREIQSEKFTFHFAGLVTRRSGKYLRSREAGKKNLILKQYFIRYTLKKVDRSFILLNSRSVRQIIFVCNVHYRVQGFHALYEVSSIILRKWCTIICCQ